MPAFEILYFGASWCGPCKAMKPIINSLEQEGRYKIRRIDVDEEPEVTMKYDITSVPTLVFQVEDTVWDRVYGAIPEVKVRELIANTLKRYRGEV